MFDTKLLSLSDDEFTDLVSDAFATYRNGDMLALSTSPLANSSLTEPCFLEGEPITPAVRARIMRSLLRWGVDTLRAGGQPHWMAFEWRFYNVLDGFYMQGMRLADLVELMGIAENTFDLFRQRTIIAVSQRLRTELETPQAIQIRQHYAIADLYASRSLDEQLLLRIMAIFRDAIPTELLLQLALEANGQHIQTSIHNLLTSHLLLSDERRTEISIQPQIPPYLLTLLLPQERKSWHDAAGRYYEKQLAYIEAAHHFRQASAYQPAAQLLINHYQALVDDNQVAQLRQLLNQFQLAEVSREQWVRLQLVAGKAAEFMGDLDSALEKYRQALAAKELPIKAEAYYRRAKVFELKNIDEALAHYEVGINLLERSPALAPLLLVQMYIHRCCIFIQERPDLDQAAAALSRAETLIDRDEHLAEWADLHNAWSQLLWRRKELDRALEHRLNAWLAANELQDVERIIKIGHNLGINYIRLGHYERALEYLHKGLALAIKANNKQMEGPYNDHIGACYFWLTQYEEAQRYYKMAYEIHVESGNHNWRAHSCYNLAEVYIELGQVLQARQYFQEGVAIAKEVGDERLLGQLKKLWPQTELNERQRQGVQYVKRHDEIANRTYRKVTGATQKLARNDLKDLLEKGVFKKVGKGRSVRYVLVKPGR